MNRMKAGFGLICVLSLASLAAAQSERADLATALTQVEQGEFDAALLNLDGLIKKLSGSPQRTRDLAQAYLLQGIAFVSLDQADKARASFRQALTLDRAVLLNRERFAPKIVQLFDETRQAVYPKKKSNTALILLAGAALAGGGVAVAASGKQDGPSEANVPVAEMFTGTTTPGTSNQDCRQSSHRFSMSRSGNVLARLESLSTVVLFVGYLCVGSVATAAGADCLGPTTLIGASIQFAREMPAGTNSVVVQLNGGCTQSVTYTMTVSHPR